MQPQADELGDAQPGGIKRLEHGPIAQPERSADVGRGQQRFDLSLAEHLGQTRRLAGQDDLERRVGDDATARVQMAIKAAQGRDVARLRSRTQGARQLGNETHHRQLVGRKQRTSRHLRPQPARQMQEVAAVAGERGAREAILEPQGVAEGVDFSQIARRRRKLGSGRFSRHASQRLHAPAASV